MAAWPHYSGEQVQGFPIRMTNGMAIGLFGTLFIGTFAKIPGLETVGVFANVNKGLMGAGIGVALSLEKGSVAGFVPQRPGKIYAIGDPKEVINAKMIEDVYEVGSDIIADGGTPHVILQGVLGEHRGNR